MSSEKKRHSTKATRDDDGRHNPNRVIGKVEDRPCIKTVSAAINHNGYIPLSSGGRKRMISWPDESENQ